MLNTKSISKNWGGADLLRPNISYCVDRNDTHYNPYEIIMTQDSNAPMMNIAYKMGWCKSPYFMTKKEAEKVNVLPTYFANEGVKIKTFDEFKYFTNIKKIGAYQFKVETLEHITLPNTITTIGTWAFGNSQITDFIIPQKVDYIEEFAFRNIGTIKWVICSPITPPNSNRQIITASIPIYVKDEYVQTYKENIIWKNNLIKPLSQFKNDFPDENIETDDINYGG